MALQRISFSPDPPLCEQTLVICYNFSDSGISLAHLKVTFTPPVVSPAIYTVTTTDPCVTIFVPEGAMSILVQDMDGKSPPRGAVIG